MRCELFLIGAVVLAGCDTVEQFPHDPEAGISTASTGPGGDGGGLLTGGGGDGGAPPVCFGTCERSISSPFIAMGLYSIGPPDQVLPCPGGKEPGPSYFGDLQFEPATCPTCTCAPAACALPQTMHASAAMCADADAAVSTPFDAPGGGVWEGGCTDDSAIPAGLQCNGVDCVQSITVDTSAMVEPCKPLEQGKAKNPPWSWGTVARECLIHIDPSGPGCAIDETCVTASPEGFRLCLFAEGDKTDHCIAPYKDAFLVHHGGPEDSRACSPCSCGDPEGAACSALLSVYTDSACGVLLGSYTVTNATDESCHDLPPGSGLGSKQALLQIDQVGQCVPGGGKPVGAVEPPATETYTLCCQPPAKAAE